ncbi:MAG TPA: cytochrome c1 protein, partial [Burkholderiaceae bacterium]|nr:cytochrome c1 protein [Burkholderiaceae bacterium]
KRYTYVQRPSGREFSIRGLARSLLLLAALVGITESASALPSYARQTGHPCVKCHVGGFGPQLTPYGVKFKISAYTETDHKGLKIPVAMFAYGGLTHTSKDQIPPPLDEHANDNLTLDQVSGFIAGRWFEDVGSFVQVTYNGNTEGLSADNTDIRYAHDWVIGGHDAIIGVSLNNNPTVQDPFNTLFAWNFPYLSSAVGFGQGGTGTQISGGLGPAVWGVSAYTFVDDSILAEVGTYRAYSPAMQIKLGLGAGNDIGRIDDSIYYRLAYLQDMNKQAFSVGLVGFNLSRQRERIDGGPVDRYRDIGVDGWYQFLGNGRHNLAAYASYVREDQTLADTLAGGGAANLNGRLYDFRLNGSYYYEQTYGLTIGRFSKHGTSDPVLYAPTVSPDTTGTVFQIDYTPFGKPDSWGRPFANARVGLQYTIYDRYNGASSNWDGAGRSASDNNTLYLFWWMAI